MKDKLVNRVVEVDMDDLRNPTVMVRNIITTPHRDQPLPDNHDIEEETYVLLNGVLAGILVLEENGTMKKGEAIKRAIKFLETEYSATGNDAHENKYDKKGNRIAPKNE